MKYRKKWIYNRKWEKDNYNTIQTIIFRQLPTYPHMIIHPSPHLVVHPTPHLVVHPSPHLVVHPTPHFLVHTNPQVTLHTQVTMHTHPQVMVFQLLLAIIKLQLQPLTSV